MQSIPMADHILGDLYNALEDDPKSVYIHERLLEVWKDIGDEGMKSFSTPFMNLETDIFQNKPPKRLLHCYR